jgi:histidinol-phosphate aminotransferase
MSFFRKNIDEMQAYEPGEQPLPGTKVIKLNTNENPYPPSPKAIEAMKKLDGEMLRRYPDPLSTHAREAAAQIYDVPAEYIMAVNGSDEILAYIARACVEPGRKMAYPVPTYLLYPVLGRMQDCDCVEVPYNDDFSIPVGKLIEADGAVTIICSPNNPDGNTASLKDLRALAENLAGLLVVDEAYCDFAAGNAMELVKEFSNVMVLRTLSKGYSLAGLRLGFGIAHPDILKGIFKVKDSYNVSAMAIRIGAAAMLDQDYLKETVALVVRGRAKLAEDLAALGFKIWPSQSNFLFVRPPGGDAENVFQSLRKRGILVRHFSRPGIKDKMRIAVGTPEEMDALIAALKDILK